jgi:transglutaminase-like putative cysteine protease
MAATTQVPASSTRALEAVDRYLQISVFLLVATGILALISTGKLDYITCSLAAGVIIFKAIRIYRGPAPEIPPRTATLLVLLYCLFFPFDLSLVSRNLAATSANPSLFGAVLAAIHLLLFATVVRILSARTRRDFSFLAMLALASLLASAILTAETSFLAFLALFLIFAVSTFIALELNRAAGAAAPALLDRAPTPRRLGAALAATSFLVAAATLVLGGVLFFLIPRFTGGYLGILGARTQLLSGFTDNVRLGKIGIIKKNSAVVMRIHVDGSAVLASGVYWRGVALQHFDGFQWTTAAANTVVIPGEVTGSYHFALPAIPPADLRPLRYRVLMEPLDTTVVFLAPWPAELYGRFAVSDDVPIAAHREYLVLGKDDSVLRSAPSSARIEYSALSELATVSPGELRAASADYPAEVRASSLQLPSLDPRVVPLAQQITARATTPYDKAVALENYLQAHYAYTLNLAGSTPSDPLAYFLFQARAGHCEYFATAMTVMLRAVGIPARYVTGFLPGEYNDVGGDYIVRASDAHTWMEAYFSPYGWITFDPTPPSAPPAGGPFSRFALYWDWFQYTWGDWVINYDIAHQVTLARSVQRSTLDWNASFRIRWRTLQEQALAQMRIFQSRLIGRRREMLMLLVVLLLALAVIRFRSLFGRGAQLWRLWATPAKPASPSLVVFSYNEMLRLLEARGWRKHPAQTSSEFAASIPSQLFAEPVAALTQLYEAARFGHHPPDSRSLTAQLDRIRSLRRTPSGPSVASTPLGSPPGPSCSAV